MADPTKIAPDEDAINTLWNSERPPTYIEFATATNPKLYKGLPAPGWIDSLVHMAGLSTDNTKRLIEAGEQDKVLRPIHAGIVKDWAAIRSMRANSPTMEEANAQHPGLLNPTSGQMMAGPQIETQGSNIDQALAPTGQRPAIGMDLYPGVSQGQASPDPLNLRSQPLGGHFGTPGAEPQGFGTFAQDPYAERPPQPTPYQAPQYAPGPRVVNPNARLNPVQMGALSSYEHQQSLRPSSPGAQSGDVLKYGEGMRLAQAAFKQLKGRLPTDAELFDMHNVQAERVQKEAQPGTIGERKAVAELGTAETEEKNRQEVLRSQVNKNDASASQDRASAFDLMNLTRDKKAKLGAETRSLNAGVVHAEQRVATAQDKATLDALETKLKYWKTAVAWDQLDKESKQKMMKFMFQDILSPGQAIGPKEQNWFFNWLGIVPKLEVKGEAGPVEATPDRAFTGHPATSAPEGSRNPSGQSLTPSTPPAQPSPAPDAKDELRLLQKMMQEGEVKEYKGKKYTIQRGQFGEIN